MECGSALVGKSGVVFAFAVEADIDVLQLRKPALFDRLAAAPHFVCHDKLAELGSPVAEIVYGNGFVALKIKHIAERVSDDSRTDVSEMEALCNVGRGKIKANRFALTASRAAEIRIGVDFSEFFGKIFL